MTVVRFFLVAAFFLASSAIAGDQALLECRSVKNDIQRLACYDRLADRLAAAPEQPARTAPKAAPPSPEQSFGLRPEGPSEIWATIDEIRTGRRGARTFVLDNGQVWQEKILERGLQVREGDEISIRQGAFGSYRLHGAGNRHTRVERVE